MEELATYISMHKTLKSGEGKNIDAKHQLLKLIEKVITD
jgi:hypothetical protein